MPDDQDKARGAEDEGISAEDVEYVAGHLSDDETDDVVAGEAAAGPALGNAANTFFDNLG